MLARIEISFILLALLAEVIGTIGGFGSSVFFVPIANFYFDFQTVLGLTAVFHVASNLSKILLFRKGLDKDLILYLGIPAIAFVIVGGFLSRLITSSWLEVILGIFLVTLSLLFLLFKDLAIKKGKIQAFVGGSASGFVAGLVGTGGAIRGLTMAAFNLEKSVFIATSAAIDFGVDLSRSFVYYFNGYIKSEILIYLPFLIMVAIVGSWIGKNILHFIPQRRFKIITLLLILGIGIMTILQSLLT